MIKLFLFLISTTQIINLFAQEKGHLLFTLSPESNLKTVKSLEGNTWKVQLSDTMLTSIFKKYHILKFEKAYPTVHKESHPNARSLDMVYLVEVKSNIEQLYIDLQISKSPIISGLYLLNPKSLHTPNDFSLQNNFMYGNPINSGTQLDLIDAKKAWDITKGSDNIIIGVVDTNFDTTHEELSGKILNSVSSYSSSSADHGTSVAGLAAAKTNNGIGVSSIGYNSKLKLYSGLTVSNILVAAQEGAKVINCSFMTSCSFVQYEQQIIDIVTSAPYYATVVAAAGNGLTGGHCGINGNDYVYPASYNGVISVSSVGHHFDPPLLTNGKKFNWKDHHDWSIGEPQYNHTHNDKVDLVSTGYNLAIIKAGNSYHSTLGHGTSSAAPVVAGLSALILSVNQDLQPGDVEAILKCSSKDIYEIPQNYPYLNLLGTGRINAFKAVELAQTWVPGTGISKQKNPPSDIKWYEIFSNGAQTEEIEVDCLSENTSEMCSVGYRLEAISNNTNQQFKWLIFYSENGVNISSNVKFGNSVILTRGFDYPNTINNGGRLDIAVRVNDCIPSNYYSEYRLKECFTPACEFECEEDVIITGNYSTPITHSSTWIKSAAVTTIVNSANVRLDANSVNGYILIEPSGTDYFLAMPSDPKALFVAQSLDGCDENIPARILKTKNYNQKFEVENKQPVIYPNPVFSEINIKYNNLKNAKISIFNMSGQQLDYKINFSGDGKAILSLNQKASGFYFIKIVDDKSIFIKRIIII